MESDDNPRFRKVDIMRDDQISLIPSQSKPHGGISEIDPAQGLELRLDDDQAIDEAMGI